MSGNYIAPGSTVEWLNKTGNDYLSGAVVIVGDIATVCEVDIADDETGTVCIEGVFEVACKSSDTINIGERLAWDVSAGKMTTNLGTAATGDCENCAVAMSYSGPGNLLVNAKLTPGTGSTT